MLLKQFYEIWPRCYVLDQYLYSDLTTVQKFKYPNLQLCREIHYHGNDKSDQNNQLYLTAVPVPPTGTVLGRAHQLEITGVAICQNQNVELLTLLR